MYTNQDIYNSFRRMQSKAIGRPYRLPKDWEYYYNVIMADKNKEFLDTITLYFNTKWQNIDPTVYFNIGFDLFGKKFGYHKFLSKKILLHYIERDKHIKRNLDTAKRDIVESAKHVLKITKSIREYCHMSDGNLSLPVSDYLKNNIDKYFLVWLIRSGSLHLNDHEYINMPYISEKFREYRKTVLELEPFFTSIRRKFHE